MYFKTSLFCTLLLASAALAVPITPWASGLTRRREGRRSRPSNRAVQADVSSHGNSTANEYTIYSSNWVGAAFTNEIYGTFTYVTGTFTVPIPSGNAGTSASAWVGIDGASCASAILQTGVDFNVDDGGQTSYDAWYEWFPLGAIGFSGISFNAGDVVVLSVVADSSTSGTATILNTSNGQQVSQYITSDSALCQADAEWIVEDYEENGGLVPFADFGTVTFTDAYAGTVYSNDWYANGAGLWDLSQNGMLVAYSYINGDGDVVITYND